MKWYVSVVSVAAIATLFSCSKSSDEMTYSSSDRMQEDMQQQMEKESEYRREENVEIMSPSAMSSSGFSAKSGGEGVADVMDGLMGTSGSRGALQRRSGSVQLNQIVSQSFYADSRYARERYLAYSITLKYVSQDFAYSREKLFEALEKYGFLVQSDLEVNANSCFEQIVHAKIKTDSLYRALEIFDEIGIVIEEKVGVVDHTNSVSVQRDRMVTKAESEESDESVVRDVRNISQTNVRDAVEWADFNITIEGVEPVVVYRTDDTKLNRSLDVLTDRVLGLIGLLIENMVLILMGLIVIIFIRKGVLHFKTK